MNSRILAILLPTVLLVIGAISLAAIAWMQNDTHGGHWQEAAEYGEAVGYACGFAAGQHSAMDTRGISRSPDPVDCSSQRAAAIKYGWKDPK